MPPPSVYVHRLKDMAGKPYKGHLSEEGFVEHVGYTNRHLRDKIHAPFRATQVGGGELGDVLERVQSGGWDDHVALAAELFQRKDLDELFTYPKAAAALIQNVPMVKLIKGVPEIAAKGEDITAADVSG